MLSTFQALVVAVLALLPGAFYTFCYERVVGSFGQTAADRFVRFFAVSAVFHGLFAWLELMLYRTYVVTGSLRAGAVNPALFELLAVLYIGLPSAAGLLVGYGKRRGWRWVTPITGKSVEPRAWDHLWREPGMQAIVRLKLKSGFWLAGLYGTAPNGRQAYAAGYPENGDLYLSQIFQVNAKTGAFKRDAEQRPLPVDSTSGLLVRWDEVEYLEVQEFYGGEDE